MKASFFYCHGTNYLYNFMTPFTDSEFFNLMSPLAQASLLSIDNDMFFRVGNQLISGRPLVEAAIPGLNGEKYMWNMTPADDPFPRMLDPNLWDDRVMVPYPAVIFPGNASIEYGRASMVSKISALTRGKKFAIGGFSQGAAVASSVYLSGLKPGTTGPLESRRADFLGAVTFGNPRRQVNHRGAGGQFGTWSGSWWDDNVEMGAGGCFPDSGPQKRLTGCEDKWVDFVAPGEVITGNGTSEKELEWQFLSSIMIASIDPAEAIKWVIKSGIEGLIDTVSQMMSGGAYGRVGRNYFIDADGNPRDVGGGGHTAYGIWGLPNSSGVIPTTDTVIGGQTYRAPVGQTMYQVALEWLNDQAAEYTNDPLVIPPPNIPTPGWSTTVYPPA